MVVNYRSAFCFVNGFETFKLLTIDTYYSLLLHFYYKLFFFHAFFIVFLFLIECYLYSLMNLPVLVIGTSFVMQSKPRLIYHSFVVILGTVFFCLHTVPVTVLSVRVVDLYRIFE